MSEALTRVFFAFCTLLGFFSVAGFFVLLATTLVVAIVDNIRRQLARPSRWRRWRYCSKGNHRDTLHQAFGRMVMVCHDCGNSVDLGAVSALMDCPREWSA